MAKEGARGTNIIPQRMYDLIKKSTTGFGGPTSEPRSEHPHSGLKPERDLDDIEGAGRNLLSERREAWSKIGTKMRSVQEGPGSDQEVIGMISE